MPTTRGWAALGAGAALVVLWVVFGERLLLAGAAFLTIAVAMGTIYVRRIDPRVALNRTIVPTQVHDGDRVIVTLEVSAARRVYQPTLRDTVHPLGAAQFFAHRIDAGVPMVARYEVQCRPRGIYTIGPADIQVRDPLGLSQAGGAVGTPDRLVVYPKVDDLDGLPIGRGQDPTANTSRASYSQTSGEDFFTLREYQQGDDLRRVHWPSSAKRDELMIRQLEIPWQSRALVVLDPRRGTYRNDEAFEHAVRGTASVIKHLYAAGYAPRLWAGGRGPGTPVGSADGYALAMEELATVRTATALDLEATVARLRKGGSSGGILVLVTGVADDADLAVFRTFGRDFYRTLVMSVAEAENEAILRLGRAGVLAVLGSPETPWTGPWRNAMERAWSTATAG